MLEGEDQRDTSVVGSCISCGFSLVDGDEIISKYSFSSTFFSSGTSEKER